MLGRFFGLKELINILYQDHYSKTKNIYMFYMIFEVKTQKNQDQINVEKLYKPVYIRSL